ncbi:DNA-binding transcriptional regulator CytR [Clostridia bacterium]|nr:DNA-binding transcriptional regulator CytR [Clostridia bacterium]
MVVLKDVADILGVSTATVSLALNGSGLVNAETKERVVELANEMGYIPNSIARNLVRRKSNELGLIVPDIENVYYSQLVKYIDIYARDAGYRLFVSISNNDAKIERETISAMVANRVEGVVVVPVNVPNSSPDYFKLLRSHGIPFAFASSMYPEVDAPFVVCDMFNGMYQLTRYLIEKYAYNHYVMITGPQNVNSLRQREEGFVSALKDAGDAEYEIIRVNNVDYSSACEATAKLIITNSHIDAIMCVNDTMAIGVINVLLRNGLKVPDDIAVTGFDNSLFAEVSVVPVTTVLQDIQSIAKQSISVLLKCIAGESLSEKGVYIPTQIIRRSSTELAAAFGGKVMIGGARIA